MTWPANDTGRNRFTTDGGAPLMFANVKWTNVKWTNVKWTNVKWTNVKWT